MKRVILIFLLINSIVSAQFANWEIVGTMPNPVDGGEVWSRLDTLYILGGYSDSVQSVVNWIQKYNIHNQTWSYDSMSTERYGFVIDQFGEDIYIFGGVQTESSSLAGIERLGFTFVNDGVFSFNNNFNRIFSTGHIINGNYYIIGGYPLAGTAVDSIAYITEYNLNESEITFQTDSLHQTEDLPYQQMSVVIGDNIFIFGGVYNVISQDIYKFNVKDYSYEKLDIKLLEPRAGGCAVFNSFDNKIYIIGGYNEKYEALNSVEIFTVIGEEYYIEEGPPINEPRYNFMARYIDDRIFILGGKRSELESVGSIEFLISGATTSIEEKSGFSSFGTYHLAQNYPNPFNPSTTIRFEVPNNKGINNRQHVSITIYDVIGNEIARIVNSFYSPGSHSIVFNANDLPNGVYYYQMKSENFVLTKKMILLK